MWNWRYKSEVFTNAKAFRHCCSDESEWKVQCSFVCYNSLNNWGRPSPHSPVFYVKFWRCTWFTHLSQDSLWRFGNYTISEPIRIEEQSLSDVAFNIPRFLSVYLPSCWKQWWWVGILRSVKHYHSSLGANTAAQLYWPLTWLADCVCCLQMRWHLFFLLLFFLLDTV